MQKTGNIFLTFFGVRREESETVGMFFLHHFFLGLGQAMFFIAAISKFLDGRLTPKILSQVFVFSAVVLLVVGRIYAYFEHLLPFKKLSPRVLLFLVGLTTSFWLAFRFYHGDIDILLVLLETAFFIVYLLCNLEFWGLSALVFDVRQGKRLFSLISSGDVPAKMLGYLFVALFTPKGEENLLIISAFAFLISYFILKNLLPKVDLGNPHHSAEYTQAQSDEVSLSSSKIHGLKYFFGNRLILNLSILSFLYYAVFITIEFIFYVKIHPHEEGTNAEQGLAHKLGGYLSICYALIFILKLAYSGKLLNRIGIKRALLAMPVVLGIFSFIYFFYGSEQNNSSNIFFIGIMAMTAFVLKYALNDPTFLVLFQPMPVRYRLQGHTVIKAFVQSVALAVSGITLWAAYVFWGEKVNFFYYLNFELFFLIVAWIFLVYVCYRNYISVLNEAIKKRFITGNELTFNDADYNTVLNEKLNSNLPDEQLFALNALDKSAPETIKAKIPELLRSQHIGVKNKTIDVIVKHKWSSFLPELYTLLGVSRNGSGEMSFLSATPNAPPLTLNSFEKAHLITACAYLDDESYLFTESFFNDEDPIIKSAFIIGFINSGDLSARITAGQQLMTLIASGKNTDRVTACHIIGTLKNPSLQKQLSVLLYDKDPKVRIAAINAAGQVQPDKIIPDLLQYTHSPIFKKYAIHSLGLYGNKLNMQHLISDSSNNQNGSLQTPQLSVLDGIKIAEKAGSKSAIIFLLQQLSNNTSFKKPHPTVAHTDNFQVRGAAVAALNILAFKPEKPEKEIVNQILNQEFIHAHWLLKTATAPVISDQLKACIRYELDLCIARIFQLCRLLFNSEAVKKAEAAMYLAQKEKKANALEMLDNIIPKKIYFSLSTLIDNLSDEAKLQQLKMYADTNERTDLPLRLIQQGENKFTKWTISVALQQYNITSESFNDCAFYLHNKSNLLAQSSEAAIQRFKNENKTETIMQAHMPNQRLTDMEKVFVLKSTQLFSETPENIIAEIVPIVKEMVVSVGDIIFNKGDIGNSMYIIYEGSVKIHDGDKIFIINGRRDFFGELALLDPEPRSASATATADTLLLKLDEEEWYELMEERPEVLRSILRILCRRIRHQNELLIK